MKGDELKNKILNISSYQIRQVNGKVKSRDEAKGYCYGWLDALCELDEDYDELSNFIDELFKNITGFDETEFFAALLLTFGGKHSLIL